MFEIHDIGHYYLFANFQARLASLNIGSVETKDLIQELSRGDTLRAYNSGVLRSDQIRKTFSKSHFHFVAPVQIHLGQNSNGNERFLQYIPIKETLALFKQDSVKDQYSETRACHPKDNIVEDISDGKAFRSNRLFTETPSALRIILYQDGFEVVNPLRSGKKKHKVLAVYLSLGDLLPYNRSIIDHMQLVLLCREQDFKEFGQKAGFAQLIEDISDLEKTGINIGGDAVVKGTILCVTGDNLGSYCIGGFTENFSSAKYLCRYCLHERVGFENISYSQGPRRTVDIYEEAVESPE